MREWSIFFSVMVCLITSRSYATHKDQCLTNEHELVGEMECGLAKLSKSSFAIVNLELSQKERSILEKMKIMKDTDTSGDFEKIRKDLPTLFRSFTDCKDEEIESLSALTIRIASSVLKSLNQETGWFTIRSSKRNSEFDLARWHQDGCFFCTHYPNSETKFAAALKGAQTLFYELSKDEKPHFLDYAAKANWELNEQMLGRKIPSVYRTKLAEFLKASKVEHANQGQGAFFLVGSDNAAVHSEPKIDDDRLFISIVPGSQAEVKAREQFIESRRNVKQVDTVE